MKRKAPPRYFCNKCGKSFTATNERLEEHNVECPYTPTYSDSKTSSLSDYAKEEMDNYVDMGCFANPHEAKPYLIDGWRLGYLNALQDVLPKIQDLAQRGSASELIDELVMDILETIKE